MKTSKIHTLSGVLGLFFALLPLATMAATPLKLAAWLPFWKKQSGAQDFALQMDKFSEISPFSYEVNTDGTLKDSLKMTEGFWPGYLSAAKDMKIKVLPTIAMLDGDQIFALLSNKTLRIKHEDIIAKLVKDQKYDGIDIDYEGKSAETRTYFNTFIMGLATRLHSQKKTLVCTLEARMPLADRYKVIPKDMAYSNDYVFLNKYCDSFRIMAYDQGTIDLTLDAKKGASDFYAPVADPAWVEKVIKETLKMVPASKIMLGIPTYGYEYEIFYASSTTTYKRLRSFTFSQFMDRADSANTLTTRSSSNELTLVYPTSSPPIQVSKNLTYIITSTTLPAGLFPAPLQTLYITMDDAASILDKIKLAKKYKLRGAAFFKMDGDVDPALWEQF